MGGEYATSATYLSEVASKGRRGFYSSFQYVTLVAGQLTALGVQILLLQVLTDDQMHSWGWRIPFVMSRPTSPVRRPRQPAVRCGCCCGIRASACWWWA
ncbi:arabinose efflux permease family protein [Mycobacteroides abscessus subsp. abscessus]|nr:arabinose efflux permease family protein [Mycobacteroides abscessus subsp. abscessus]